MKLPFDLSENSLLQAYQMAYAQFSLKNDLILIRISIPLIQTDDFQLLRITPIPQMVDGKIFFLKITHGYIAISSKTYTELTDEDISKCNKFRTNFYCIQNKAQKKISSNNSCVLSRILKTNDSDSCEIVEAKINHELWIKLLPPNSWIFTTNDPTYAQITCNGTLTSQTKLNDTGLLKVKDTCIISTNFSLIQPLLDLESMVIPKSSFSQNLWNI
jgi:hypothetical protein